MIRASSDTRVKCDVIYKVQRMPNLPIVYKLCKAEDTIFASAAGENERNAKTIKRCYIRSNKPFHHLFLELHMRTTGMPAAE